MTLPSAFVVHSTRERQRIRIPECRGDLRYFAKIRKAARKAPMPFIRVNALTASILFVGHNTSPDAVARFGEDHQLFAIAPALPAPSLAKQMTAPLMAVDKGIREVSVGRLDLPGSLFILLLLTAIYEIASGRFKMPPWYTAFWYAFGLFTKAMLDRESGSRAAVR